jgi:hypothetical protein
MVKGFGDIAFISLKIGVSVMFVICVEASVVVLSGSQPLHFHVLDMLAILYALPYKLTAQ